MEAPRLSEDELNEVYSWVDQIPLSRPKKNIARDFSDGVLVAEIIAQHFPRMIELHNYSAANSLKQKNYNWETLNKKVFRRLGFQIGQSDVASIIDCKPEAIERILKVLKNQMLAFATNPNNISPDKQNMRQTNGGSARFNNGGMQQQNGNQLGQQHSQQQDEIIWEKEQVIGELKETIEIMELKIKKLEDLMNLKDNKIKTMQNKMAEHGLY